MQLQTFKHAVLRVSAPFVQLPVTGLDISDRSAKYVKLAAGRHNTVFIADYGEFPIPEGILIHGIIKDEDALADVFKKWSLQKPRALQSSYFTVSLPEEKSFVSIIQIPKVKEADIANAIRWEIENQIPLPLEETIYDYEVLQPLQDGIDHLDALVTAFPRELVEGYVRTLKKADLQPIALELESQSIARACGAARPDASANIILDIGKTRTSLTVSSGGAIVFTATIQMGGMLMEQHLQKTLAVTPERAREIKEKIGLNKREQNGEIFAALAPSISLLADELVRATDYYSNHTGHIHGGNPSIDTILISGGDGNLFGLDTYLAGVLKIPVEHANPFVTLRSRMALPIPQLTSRESLAYTCAIGLALYNLPRVKN